MPDCPVCKTPIDGPLARCETCGASLTQRLSRPPTLVAPELASTGTQVISTRPPTQRISQSGTALHKPSTQRIVDSSEALVKPATQRVVSTGAALVKPATQRVVSTGTALVKPATRREAKPGTRILAKSETQIISEAPTQRMQRADERGATLAPFSAEAEAAAAAMPEMRGGRIMFWLGPLLVIAAVAYDYFQATLQLQPFFQFLLLLAAAFLLFGQRWAIFLLRMSLCFALAFIALAFYEVALMEAHTQVLRRELWLLGAIAASHLVVLANYLFNRGLIARYT